MLSDGKILKSVVLLHGTDGSPQDCWLPWLKREMESKGYVVRAPRLPNSLTPDREVYEKFLLSRGYEFADSILIGHSSGATTVLNLLQLEKIPTVDTAVLVGVFLNERLTSSLSEPGQFDKLWPPDGFDIKALKKAARRFIFIHGDNDPYCSYDDAREFAEALNAQFITVPNGLHLSNSSGIKELPQIVEALKQ